MQVLIWHAPVEQSGVPLETTHAFPHAPQFATVFSCDSQPFDATPSQSA
jgi:hypothetical protein